MNARQYAKENGVSVVGKLKRVYSGSHFYYIDEVGNEFHKSENWVIITFDGAVI